MDASRRSALARLLLGGCAYAALAARNVFAETITYTYDALGRIVTASYSNGATVTYTYDAAGNRTTLTQTPPGSVQAFLNANPIALVSGSNAALNWVTNNATSAAINQGVGTVTPTAGGSASVSPTSTTTYTLTAQGPNGPAIAQALVTVYAAPTLSANPGTINQGQSSTLTWSCPGALSVSINNSVGAVTPAAGGSVAVTPMTTTTYTLTATYPGGVQGQTQATVTVNVPTWTETIQITGAGPVNLRTLANNAGYNGAQAANVTFEVGNNVTITGLAGGIAIDSGVWPTGTYTITLSLVVKTGGIVRGGGGVGGAGGSTPSAGGAGGDAIYCRVPMSVTIESGAQARGGGGGGGGASTVFEGWPEPDNRYGGGGGGGAPNGAGGAGDPPASNGANATVSGGGAGGAGANGGVSGGLGGAYGANGANGQGWLSPSAPGGAGGAAGYCIRKNGHSVTVTNNGTTSGTIG
jgi:YD repeat-containing protein